MNEEEMTRIKQENNKAKHSIKKLNKKFEQCMNQNEILQNDIILQH